MQLEPHETDMRQEARYQVMCMQVNETMRAGMAAEVGRLAHERQLASEALTREQDAAMSAVKYDPGHSALMLKRVHLCMHMSCHTGGCSTCFLHSRQCKQTAFLRSFV